MITVSIFDIVIEAVYNAPIALAVLVATIYYFGLVIQRLVLSPVAKFPGPKLAAATFWYEFYFDVVKRGSYFREIAKMHQKYGPVVRINPHELHVDDPNFYSILYTGPTSKRHKWPWAAKMFGNNTSTFSTVLHDHHRVRRAALNPLFSKPAIQRLEPMIQSTMYQLCGRLDTFSECGKVLDLGLAFAVFAADVISEYCFGGSFGLLGDPDFAPDWVDEVAAPSELGHLVKQCPFVIPLFRLAPGHFVKWIAPSIDRLYTIQEVCSQHLLHAMGIQVQNLLEKKRAKDAVVAQTCVFDALLAGSLPAHEKTVERLKGEGQTLIGAGTLTTANVLKTIVFHCLDNPLILQTLLGELDMEFPDPTLTVDLRSLEKLPFLTACITEALRLAYGVTHRLQLIAPNESLKIHGMEIPPGTPVGMTSIFMHDNPIIFPEPRAFKPERWLDPEKRRYLSRYLVPFSQGTRMCLGMHLAWAEIYIVVGTIFRRYSLSLFETSRDDIEMARDFFDPSPKLDSNGLRVKIAKR
ncbi:putative cytochrome P450 [Lepidopterella palustris CBS 459.81]|uniref:Putative cytochrome P450 n=1 Tax=Lepidopterella palustris CBS 459.81 TaxID=1314670 RepID=A0A8E2JCL1_9PEZI|nr:putative cytochrome P450 [Lepidopterella palustris CBS 459.81]